MFGNPETTSGGNALKFFASQRVEIRRWDKVMDDKEQVWYLAKIKIVKNKIFAPFKSAEIPVKRWSWYDHIYDVIEAWLILKLINRSGAFYSIWTKKSQWKEKFIQLLSEDQKLLDSLEKDIQNQIKDIRAGKKALDDIAFDEVNEIIDNLE
jgi:recombination protein RecA